MKTLLKVAFSEILRIGLFPLRILKIKSNRILFTGLTGAKYNEYSCNPKYVCEYILKHYPNAYEIVWAVHDPEQYRWLEEKGIRLVKHYSLRSFVMLQTSRVIVSNGSYAPWFPFRKGQYFINTWHGGGAYKRVENDKPDANWATRQRVRFCAENIDLFLSSCKMASKKLFRESYRYQGEIMEVGMPRNDFLVRQELEAATARVKAYYGIPQEDHLILYAPTYRYGNKQVILNTDKVLEELERDGGKWHFLYRAHSFQDERTNLKVNGSRIVDASRYPDTQELLAASEWLLTDYSSMIWDYSFLERPCVLYVPDVEEYMEKTGFYVPIRRWPFPMAESEEALLDLIRNFDMNKCRTEIEKHHKMMGNTETGHACEMTAKRIAQVCKG